MKHFLKGVVIVVGVMIVDIFINIICNINGIDLNSTANTFAAVGCAMYLYYAWTRNEKNKDDQE